MNANSLQSLQKAAACFQRGDFHAALEASELALAQAPGHAEGLHMKALCLGRLGRVDEALPLFDQVASVHPKKHIILTNKGNALRAAERFLEAIAAYEAAVSVAPGHIPGWIALGNVHWRAGDPVEAEKILRDALSRAPADPNLLNNLGVLLDDQAKSAEAVEMFTAALAIQAGMLSARVNRGAALRKIGRLEEALADLESAAKSAPSDAEAHYQHANALRQAGVVEQAESAFQRALASAPDRTDIHRDMARMLWEAGAGERFLEPLNEVISRRPAAALFALKSELALLAGLPDLAEAAALASLELDPKGVAPRRSLALIRRSRSDLDGAVEMLSEAHGIEPDDFEILHALVETRIARGEFGAAIDLLRRDAPPKHLQKHIALSANASRLSGSTDYQDYYDYDRFARKMFIEAPPGYTDLASFNEALVDAILPLHWGATRPLEQTLYGGTQSSGRLWEEPIPVIQALKRQLLAAATQYVDELPDDSAHPFLSRKSRNLTCAGAWSVVLSSGGGHVDHIHPNGWISASYYVRVPKEVLSSEKSGFLRLGASGVPGASLQAERWFKPEEGAVVFFPSYIWHGVEPFESNTLRITAPFDLAPDPQLGPPDDPSAQIRG